MKVFYNKIFLYYLEKVFFSCSAGYLTFCVFRLQLGPEVVKMRGNTVYKKYLLFIPYVIYLEKLIFLY